MSVPDMSLELLEVRPPLIDLLPIAIYACDADGRLLWHNERAVSLWGRTPGDAQRYGGAPKLRLEGREIPHLQSPIVEVLRSGVPARGVEVAIERPDGSQVWVTSNIEPIRTRAGLVVGAINCFHETTQLHRTNEELVRHRHDLAESETRMQQLLDALPVAVYTTDARGHITYYNQAAVDLSGRRPVLGSDQWCVTWRLYWPDGTPLPHDECPMAQTLKEQRAISGKEAVAERPDGSRVPFIPYPTLLYDSSGRMTGAVNVLVDISERKQSETRQRILLDELNHRIKNKVQMLRSILTLARRETGSAEAHAVLDKAAHRVGMMAAAQHVLYSENKPYTYNAKRFVEEVCTNAQDEFGSSALIHYHAIEAELPNATAMPLALIMNELFTNAVKYGRKAGVEESVIEVNLSRAGDSYALVVEDEGPGFDAPADRDRWSGLGLVDGLVRQLGGRLEVTRAPGARCTLTFPQRTVAVE